MTFGIIFADIILVIGICVVTLLHTMKKRKG